MRSLPTHFWYWRVPHIPTPPLPWGFSSSIVVEEREGLLHLVDLAPSLNEALGVELDSEALGDKPNTAHGQGSYHPPSWPEHIEHIAQALKARKRL